MAGSKAPLSAKILHTVVPGFLRSHSRVLSHMFIYLWPQMANYLVGLWLCSCAKLIAGGHGMLES